MRRGALAGLILGVIVLGTVAASACGDKLVLLSAFARYRQVNAGARPASVLAYVRQNSSLTEVVRNLQSQTALKQAGHKLYVVEDSAHLNEALKTGKFDVLLADAADAEDVQVEARSAPSKPTVLPVVYKSTKTEAS